jgi:N-acetylglucosamine malate deacetylase 2
METDLLAGLARPCCLMTIFPHPDDESFATGGVLARYGREDGVKTSVLALTRGGKSQALLRVGLPEARETVIREQELRTATTILEVDEVESWTYPDGGLAGVPEDELKGRLIAAIRGAGADVVVTYGPDGITGHPDHLTCSRLVKEVAAEAGVKRLFMVSAPPWIARTVLKAEVLLPTHAVDIKAEYPVKILALKAHATQMLISRQPMIWVGLIMRAYGKEFFHRVF